MLSVPLRGLSPLGSTCPSLSSGRQCPEYCKEYCRQSGSPEAEPEMGIPVQVILGGDALGRSEGSRVGQRKGSHKVLLSAGMCWPRPAGAPEQDTTKLLSRLEAQGTPVSPRLQDARGGGRCDLLDF